MYPCDFKHPKMAWGEMINCLQNPDNNPDSKFVGIILDLEYAVVKTNTKILQYQ